MEVPSYASAPHSFPPSIHPDDNDLPSYEQVTGPAAPDYDDDDYFSDDDNDEHGARAPVFSMRQVSRSSQAFTNIGLPRCVVRVLGGITFTEAVNARSPNGDDDHDHQELNAAVGPDGIHPWSTTDREYLIEHKFGAGLSKHRPDIIITTICRQGGRHASVSIPQPSSPAPRRRSLFAGLRPRTESTKKRASSTAGLSHSTSNAAAAAVGPAAALTGTSAQTQPLASIRFARDGPWPWTPRARITYERSFATLVTGEGDGTGEQQLGKKELEGLEQEMALSRSQNHGWGVQILGRRYSWQIRVRPVRLVLLDIDARRLRASFVYSDVGSWAPKGGEVGRLRVPLQTLPPGEVVAGEARQGGDVTMGLQDGFLENIICSLTVCITHWKDECKYLYNMSPLPGRALQQEVLAEGEGRVADSTTT